MDENNFSILLVSKKNPEQQEIAKFLQKEYKHFYFTDQIRSGFEVFMQHAIDTILVDISGSEEEFLGFIENIRYIDEKVKIILFYPEEKVDFFPKSVEFNINSYKSKPIDFKKLKKILDSYREEKKSKQNLADQTKLLDDYREAMDKNFIVSKADTRGKITYVNDNFCRTSGYSREELMGQMHSIIRHPETDTKVFEELWETILPKKVWRGRIKNRKKNGDYYVVESVISPILDSNGEIKEFIAIRQDVTEFIKAGRKIIEKEKEKKEMEKEHYRELNQAKDAFLVVFTHELKTPLNAIINFAASAAKRINRIDSPRKESLIEMMQVIKENGEDMLATVTNILDLSRLKANKLEFHKSTFNLIEIIDDLINRFDSLIQEDEIEVDLDRVNLGTALYLDKMRVSQIISNILSNAIKYSHKKVKVTAVIEREKLYLNIEDNGPGIENKEKIFELYEQEDDGGIKRASKGTGVGLHFVKLLCEGMDIGLTLKDSENLGGAKFVLSFTIKGDS